MMRLGLRIGNCLVPLLLLLPRLRPFPAFRKRKTRRRLRGRTKPPVRFAQWPDASRAIGTDVGHSIARAVPKSSFVIQVVRIGTTGIWRSKNSRKSSLCPAKVDAQQRVIAFGVKGVFGRNHFTAEQP